MTGQPDTGTLSVHEPDEGHDCRWQVLGASQRGITGALMSPPLTDVLLRCEVCRMPLTITLVGHWTTDELTGPGYAMAVPAQ